VVRHRDSSFVDRGRATSAISVVVGLDGAAMATRSDRTIGSNAGRYILTVESGY
jgi:hypothetical protein